MPRRTADGLRARSRADLVAIFETLVAASRIHRCVTEQAEALGLTIQEVYRFRCLAKRAGYVFPPLAEQTRGPKPGRARALGSVSEKLLKLEAEMANESCSRCGLRGPHACTKAEDFMRTGDERTYPGHAFDGDEMEAA